jgi:hypothetical protein
VSAFFSGLWAKIKADAIALYFTAIALGAAGGTALLATWSYLVSPWLISNIYGRGGVAEGVSHGFLPVLLLGTAWAWSGRYRASTITIALGIAVLALSHNIFLLYGICFCAIVCVVGLRRTFSVRSKRARDFHPTAAGRYTLEIPMVYSRFLVARQNGNLLPAWPDFNYRLNVQVSDLLAPVDVVYQLPSWIWALAVSALAVLIALLVPITLYRRLITLVTRANMD